jgi:hypothetical protein
MYIMYHSTLSAEKKKAGKMVILLNQAQNDLIIISASLLNKDWKILVCVATVTNTTTNTNKWMEMFTKWT